MGDMTSQFIFVCCQIGAERALKSELAREWPEFRFAYSRPGFATFKLPPDHSLSDDFDLRSVFARTYGFSLGRIDGEEAVSMARKVWELAGPREFKHLHVWQRDAAVPGDFNFEPGTTALAEEVGQIILNNRPTVSVADAMPETQSRLSLRERALFRGAKGDHALKLNHAARPKDLVLDCVLAEPNEWWIGFHRAASMPSRWPGGVCEIEVPPDAVSRAYLKMAEALAWSRLPIAAGDRCVEIGSAPGGSCQALLDRGLLVTGIDPAEMDEALLEEPNFTHIKKRASDMKRREFRGFKWLTADSNVAPNYTLDAVEAIVTHRLINIRGMLLTLKLLNWELAEQIPDYLARIRSWGYHYVTARQLAHNRQEICVLAMRERSMRRRRVKTSLVPAG
jgi:23S rRNA (cytidine2498-2'-O)-methyltransferase